MVLSLFLAALLGVSFSGESKPHVKITALQFAEGRPFSYIRFYPDFSQFTHSISACGWLKSLGSAPYSTVFQYGSYEMIVSDNGRWFCILGSCTHVSNAAAAKKGDWYHMCAVWSTSSASYRYYVDGELIGSMPTRSDRLFEPGLKMLLGIRGGYYWTDSGFGGQMFYLNFYAKEFKAAEVKKMATSGICRAMALEEHQELRLVKWEYILEQTRTGNVTDVDLTKWCMTREKTTEKTSEKVLQ